MKQNIAREIIDTLASSDYGLTTQELIEKTSRPYQTITRHLARLRNEEIVTTIQKGSCRIHFLKERGVKKNG